MLEYDLKNVHLPKVGMCALGAEQPRPSPAKWDAFDMALACMATCNCAACRTARSLLERLEVSLGTFRDAVHSQP